MYSVTQLVDLNWWYFTLSDYIFHPFIIIILCLLSVFVVLGNSLVVSAIWHENQMHSVTNYLIASLAAADCLVGALVMPFSIVSEIIIGSWTFGATWCDLWHSFDVLASTASIMNLCLISYDRYLAITDPISYPARMTPKRVALFIVSLWTCSSLISFPAIIWWRAVGSGPLQQFTMPTTSSQPLSPLPATTPISIKSPSLLLIGSKDIQKISSSMSSSNNTNKTLANVVNEQDEILATTNDQSNQLFRCVFTDDTHYLLFSSFISFYGPLCIMLYAYYRIYTAAVQQTRFLKLGSKQVMVGNRNMKKKRSRHKSNQSNLYGGQYGEDSLVSGGDRLPSAANQIGGQISGGLSKMEAYDRQHLVLRAHRGGGANNSNSQYNNTGKANGYSSTSTSNSNMVANKSSMWRKKDKQLMISNSVKATTLSSSSEQVASAAKQRQCDRRKRNNTSPSEQLESSRFWPEVGQANRAIKVDLEEEEEEEDERSPLQVVANHLNRTGNEQVGKQQQQISAHEMRCSRREKLRVNSQRFETNSSPSIEEASSFKSTGSLKLANSSSLTRSPVVQVSSNPTKQQTASNSLIQQHQVKSMLASMNSRSSVVDVSIIEKGEATTTNATPNTDNSSSLHIAIGQQKANNNNNNNNKGITERYCIEETTSASPMDKRESLASGHSAASSSSSGSSSGASSQGSASGDSSVSYGTGSITSVMFRPTLQQTLTTKPPTTSNSGEMVVCVSSANNKMREEGRAAACSTFSSRRQGATIGRRYEICDREKTVIVADNRCSYDEPLVSSKMMQRRAQSVCSGPTHSRTPIALIGTTANNSRTTINATSGSGQARGEEEQAVRHSYSHRASNCDPSLYSDMLAGLKTAKSLNFCALVKLRRGGKNSPGGGSRLKKVASGFGWMGSNQANQVDEDSSFVQQSERLIKPPASLLPLMMMNSDTSSDSSTILANMNNNSSNEQQSKSCVSSSSIIAVDKSARATSCSEKGYCDPIQIVTKSEVTGSTTVHRLICNNHDNDDGNKSLGGFSEDLERGTCKRDGSKGQMLYYNSDKLIQSIVDLTGIQYIDCTSVQAAGESSIVVGGGTIANNCLEERRKFSSVNKTSLGRPLSSSNDPMQLVVKTTATAAEESHLEELEKGKVLKNNNSQTTINEYKQELQQPLAEALIRKRAEEAITKASTLNDSINSNSSYHHNHYPAEPLVNHTGRQHRSVGKKLSKLAKERKAAKTLGIVVGVFVLCWLPFFVVNIIVALCGINCIYKPEIVLVIVTWLGWLNSAMNPVIYACWSRDFRRAFRRVLCTWVEFICPYDGAKVARKLRLKKSSHYSPQETHLSRTVSSIKGNDNTTSVATQRSIMSATN